MLLGRVVVVIEDTGIKTCDQLTSTKVILYCLVDKANTAWKCFENIDKLTFLHDFNAVVYL